MKKYLLSLGVMAASVFSMSAVETVPPVGTIDMGIYQGGIGSVTLNVSNAKINRSCEGYATLFYNGEVLKMMPASNERFVYCTDGYEKPEYGQPFVGFYATQESPAKRPGEYTITIPANFYTVNGVGNDALVFNYTIAGTAYDLSFSPAPNTMHKQLKEIVLTFENCTNLKCANPSRGLYFENDGADIYVTPTVEGNKAIVPVPESLTKGQIILNGQAGTFTFTNPQGKTGSNSQFATYYTLLGEDASTGGFTLTPDADGVVEKFEAYQTRETSTTQFGQTYTTYYNDFFLLNLPEGCTTSIVAMKKPQLYTEDLTTAVNPVFTLQPNADKNGFYLTLTGENNNTISLSNGTYYLVIPDGAFYYMENGTRTPNTKLTFGPFVVMDMATTGFYITPDPNEEQTELSTITITFDEGSTVTWAPGEWGTLNYGAVEYDYKGVVDGNVVTITLPSPVSIPGEWVLDIPSQALTVNGKATALQAVYSLYREYIKDLTIINNEATVTPTLVDNDEEYGVPYWTVNLQTPENVRTADFTFVLPYGYDAVYYKLNNDNGGGPELVGIESSALEAEGYQLAENNTVKGLPVGTSLISFAYSQEGIATEPTLLQANVNFTTGVEGVAVEAGEARYFNLQGVEVANPENGVFIKVVNGKASKVVL